MIIVKRVFFELGGNRIFVFHTASALAAGESRTRRNVSISDELDVKRIEKAVGLPGNVPTTLAYKAPAISWSSMPTRCILRLLNIGTDFSRRTSAPLWNSLVKVPL